MNYLIDILKIKERKCVVSINIDLPEEEVKRRILFADNLRYIIRSKGISQTKIARYIGTSVSTIGRYMKGQSMPSDDCINKIADAIGCTVDELFDDTYAPWNFGADIEED